MNEIIARKCRNEINTKLFIPFEYKLFDLSLSDWQYAFAFQPEKLISNKYSDDR